MHALSGSTRLITTGGFEISQLDGDIALVYHEFIDYGFRSGLCYLERVRVSIVGVSNADLDT